MKPNLTPRPAQRPASRPEAAGFGRLASFLLRHSAFAFALAACVGLTGCFGFLKPSKATARHFVLTSLPPAPSGKGQPGNPGIGIGQVKVPAYLFNSSMAVRRGTNEIDYLPLANWAERLDAGLQRVVAANVSALVPTDQVRLSVWRSETVSAEVYVTIEQFDVDATGRAALVAWWRILSPGGEKTLKAGETHLARNGPAPDTDPSGAVATLSELVGDLSRQLVSELKAVAPPVQPAPSGH